MYIVRFIRRDGRPDEDYYYQTLSAAQYHLHLFANDESNLYSSIVLFEAITLNQETRVIDSLLF